MTFSKEPNGSATHRAEPLRQARTPSRAEVLRSVEAIIASGVLGKSDRRAALLRYLVERELDGQGQEVKAFTIAVDVLGRDASFDPNSDSIVRSEVGRLRDALMLHFSAAGGQEVRIDIPKGTYRPVITSPTETPEVRKKPRSVQALRLGLGIAVLMMSLAAVYKLFLPAPTGDERARPAISSLPYEVIRVAVAPFEGTGDNPDADELAFGIFSELSASLSAYPWISVVSPVDKSVGLDKSQVDYILIGDVHWNANTILTSARLVESGNEQLVWGDSQTLTAHPEAIRQSVRDISSRIAFDLGSMHGIASELVKARNAESSPESLAAFICFLSSYTYIAEPTDSGHLALRACLSDFVAEFPSFGDGWAALALVHIDEARFGRNPRPDRDPWQDAEAAVDQALKHAPLRMPTLNVALILSIEAPQQDRDAFERIARLLLRLYPRHPGTLNNVGSRMAEFTGQWERGLALIEEAIYLEPEPPSSFFVAQAYRAAVSGSDEEFLAAVEPLTATTSATQLLLRYLAAARAEALPQMRALRDRLAQQGLADNEELLRHVRNRRYFQEIETALLAQLERAFAIEAAQ